MTQTARDTAMEQIVDSKTEVTISGTDINSLGKERTRAKEKALQTGQTQEAFRAVREPKGMDECRRTLNLPKRWPPPKQARAQDDLIAQQVDEETAGMTTRKHKMEGIDHLV